MMGAREIDLERVKAQLKLWNAEMEHLERKMGAAERGERTGLPHRALDGLQEELAMLRQLRDEADRKTRELEQATDEDWESLHMAAEQALANLGDAFEQARSRLGQ
jgi:ElaB/YqjD/DUF883 family membrane-anchored ribosome-binding protein